MSFGCDEPIPVFNEGKMKRDFTYIDDIIEGVIGAIDQPATADQQWSSQQPNPATSYAPYKIYNIGNNNTVQLLDFIHTLEDCLGKKAKLTMLPMQKGDVKATFAKIDALNEAVGFKPITKNTGQRNHRKSKFSASTKTVGSLGAKM